MFENQKIKTFKMVNDAGDILIVDHRTESSVVAKGYRRMTREDEVVAAAGTNVGSDASALVGLTKAELQALCESQGLPTSGNKPELIERLAQASKED